MFVVFSVLAALHQPVLRAQAPNTPPPEGRRGLSLHCMPRKALLGQLKPSGGVPLFAGLIGSDGAAMEVWRNTVHPDDLWVAFLTQPDGTACVFAQGAGMEFAGPPAAPPSAGPSFDDLNPTEPEEH